MTIQTFLTRSLAAMLLIAGVAGVAGAQVTPEGTTITNTATVSFKDANNNSYSATGSASVTVGFQPGVDVTGTATYTPGTPQVGAQASFTIANTGNGTNQFAVAFTPPAALTVTGYKVGATTYATLAELNTALATTDVASGSSITVSVVYNTVRANAGQTYSFDFTANSVRTGDTGAAGNTTDAFSSSIQPADVTGVSVTPDNAAITKIPGTGYTATFTITNNGSAAASFTISGGATGTGFSVTSVNGGVSTVGPIAAGGTASVDVVYAITTAGTTGTIGLTATHTVDAATTDGGSYDVTVSKPALTLTKAAFLDNGSGAPGAAVAGPVPPGVTVWYVITVSNGATAAAAENVSVSDPLPGQLAYVSSEAVSGVWTLSEAGGTVSGTLTGNLAAGASASFRIKTTVK